MQAEQEKEKGNEAYKKKDFEAALNHYNKATELDPINMSYYTNRAGLFRLFSFVFNSFVFF
jgi:stress-induced-phosphoprotein 1